MSIAVAINRSFHAGHGLFVTGTLTPSGTYPLAGDPIDFTGLVPCTMGPSFINITSPLAANLRISQTADGLLNDTKLLIFSQTAGANAVAATNTLTSNNTNVSDGDTVTINGRVYTFKTTLTGTINQIHIGGSADASLTNLAAAINGTGTPGTDYTTLTTVNTDVSSSAVSGGHALTFTALSAGTSGNALTLAKVATTLSVGGATFSGGALGTTPAASAKQDYPTSVLVAIPFWAMFKKLN